MLAQIEPGFNSYKLKNKIRRILYLLYQPNKITKKLFNSLIRSLDRSTHCRNKILIATEPKTIYFDLSKNVGNNLKHKIDSTIKHNEHLAKHTKRNKITQLLSKYKHGNNIHKNGTK